MEYIIAEPCIGTKDTACVDVCPVDCIHPAKGRTISLGDYDKVSIITAPTSELRTFLLRNSDNYEAMAYIYYLCRSGSECALRGFEEELRRRPADDEILKPAAAFFLTRGNYDRAVELQRRRIELDPKDVTLPVGLGETLLLKRDFAGARRQFALSGAISWKALTPMS